MQGYIIKRHQIKAFVIFSYVVDLLNYFILCDDKLDLPSYLMLNAVSARTAAATAAVAMSTKTTQHIHHHHHHRSQQVIEKRQQLYGNQIKPHPHSQKC